MARENVVLVVVDDAIVDMWPRMAYLDGLPDGRWVKFPRAVVNYPLCAVSRTTLLTGRYQHNLDGLYFHGLASGAATAGTMAKWDTDVGPAHMLPQWLRTAGYYNGAFGKYVNLYPFGRGDAYIPAGWHDWKIFLDDTDLGGAHASHIGPAFFTYVMNINGSASAFGTTDAWTTTGADDSGRQANTDYSTDRINLQLRKFVETAREPFFSYTATYAVKQASTTVGPAARHAGLAYAPERAPSFAEADISDKPAWLRTGYPTVPSAAAQTAWDDEQKQKWRTAQAVDELLRDLVSALKARGCFERTVIIVMTENSNLEGQHRLDKKGLPYEPCITTPMYVRHPAAPLANATDNSLVSTIDVAPTIVDIARVRPTRPVDGMSMMGLLDRSALNWRREALFEWTNNNSVHPDTPSFSGVRTATQKYLALASLGAHAAEDELYLLDVDPDEMANETTNSAHAATKTELARRLAVLAAG